MTYRYSVRARTLITLVLLLSSTAMVIAQNPVPFLAQPLIPDAIAPAAPGLTIALTVNGTGFVVGSKVYWNGSPRTTFFVNGSRLIAFIPSSDLARPSTAWITVVSPAPGGGASNMVSLPIHNPSSTVSFQRTDYSVGGNPQFVATADFNHDGKLDLAVANYGTGMVSILLGNGDGSFQSFQNYYAGPSAQAPILGDFNGDGILDIAVPYWSCSVAVLLGRGDGTFQPASSYPSGCTATHGIAADLDGDGKLDLAIVSWGSGLSILLGNGDGTFRPHLDYAVGSEPTQAAAGDFNRDGKLDLAVSNYGSNTVSILLGNGDGTFQHHVDYATGNNPTGVSIADFNEDGVLDLAVAIPAPGDQGPGAVSVLLGRGDGTFTARVDYPTAAGVARSELGDFNGDGRLDLAVSTVMPGVDILLGNGDGTFQAPLSFAVGTRWVPWNPIAGDFNGDGRLDLATGNWGDGTISVLLAP